MLKHKEKDPDKKPVKKEKKVKNSVKLTPKDILSELDDHLELSISEEVFEEENYKLNKSQEYIISQKIKTVLGETKKNITPKKKVKEVIKIEELIDEEEIYNDIPQDNIENNNIESEPKCYIIDTNIILTDVNNIQILSQNNTNRVVIPETVLDELDDKKKGFDDINFQAREFNRVIDQAIVIEKTKEEYEGTTLNIITLKLIDGTLIDLVSKKEYVTNINNEIKSIVNDRKILEVAQAISDNKPKIVVSNDIALRARAISLDLNPEPLKNNLQKDIMSIELVKEIRIHSSQKGNIEKSDATFYGKEFSNFTNVTFVCEDTGEQILTFYKNKKFNILNEKYLRSFPVNPKNKEQLYFLNMLLDQDVPIIVCSGVTGSGKNLLALTAGLSFLNKNQDKFNMGIRYCRNTITAGDENAQLGFLKGDENAKLGVFTYPLLDSIGNYIELVQNVNKNKGNAIPIVTPKEFMENNDIEVININQMRGANLHGYLIFDEWQNSSVSVNKLMMTRINEGSKVVILGDLNQIDNPYLNKFNSALSSMIKLASTNDLVAGITLTKVQRGKIAEFAEKFL